MKLLWLVCCSAFLSWGFNGPSLGLRSAALGWIWALPRARLTDEVKIEGQFLFCIHLYPFYGTPPFKKVLKQQLTVLRSATVVPPLSSRIDWVIDSTDNFIDKSSGLQFEFLGYILLKHYSCVYNLEPLCVYFMAPRRSWSVSLFNQVKAQVRQK